MVLSHINKQHGKTIIKINHEIRANHSDHVQVVVNSCLHDAMCITENKTTLAGLNFAQ